jgi:hypothetical protein
MENNSTETAVIKDLKETLPKPKRQQSEAQKANTQKMRDALIKKHENIRAEKARLAEEKKKVKEERIVKKAIHIKKKEIKEAQELAISDDEDSEIEAPPPVKSTIPSVKSAKVDLPPPQKITKKKLPKKPLTPPSSESESEEEYYEEPIVQQKVNNSRTPSAYGQTPLQQHLKRNFPFIVTYI